MTDEPGVTLREYFDQRFADADKAIQAALAAVATGLGVIVLLANNVFK